MAYLLCQVANFTVHQRAFQSKGRRPGVDSTPLVSARGNGLEFYVQMRDRDRKLVTRTAFLGERTSRLSPINLRSLPGADGLADLSSLPSILGKGLFYFLGNGLDLSWPLLS
jgi:hypothetical protein